jgi:hypothetical protein
VRLAALYRTQHTQGFTQHGEEGRGEGEGLSEGRLPLHPIRHPALTRLLIAGVYEKKCLCMCLCICVCVKGEEKGGRLPSHCRTAACLSFLLSLLSLLLIVKAKP